MELNEEYKIYIGNNVNSLIYFSQLDAILVGFENQVKVYEAATGVLNRSVDVIDSPTKISPVRLEILGKNKIIFSHSNIVNCRSKYNDVLLLDSLFQIPSLNDKKLISLDLPLPDAQLFLEILKTHSTKWENRKSLGLIISQDLEDTKSDEFSKWKLVRFTCCRKLLLQWCDQVLPLITDFSPSVSLLSFIIHRLKSLSFMENEIRYSILERSKDVMNVEANRYLSFEKWPHKSYKWAKPEMMSRVGFYYHPRQPSDDRALCFLCNICLITWESTDEPWSEHQRHSPQCSLFKSNYTTNVPLSFTEASMTAQKHTFIDEVKVLAKSVGNRYFATINSNSHVTIWDGCYLLRKVVEFDLPDFSTNGQLTVESATLIENRVLHCESNEEQFESVEIVKSTKNNETRKGFHMVVTMRFKPNMETISHYFAAKPNEINNINFHVNHSNNNEEAAFVLFLDVPYAFSLMTNDEMSTFPDYSADNHQDFSTPVDDMDMFTSNESYTVLPSKFKSPPPYDEYMNQLKKEDLFKELSLEELWRESLDRMLDNINVEDGTTTNTEKSLNLRNVEPSTTLRLIPVSLKSEDDSLLPSCVGDGIERSTKVVDMYNLLLSDEYNLSGNSCVIIMLTINVFSGNELFNGGFMMLRCDHNILSNEMCLNVIRIISFDNVSECPLAICSINLSMVESNTSDGSSSSSSLDNIITDYGKSKILQSQSCKQPKVLPLISKPIVNSNNEATMENTQWLLLTVSGSLYLIPQNVNIQISDKEKDNEQMNENIVIAKCVNNICKTLSGKIVKCLTSLPPQILKMEVFPDMDRLCLITKDGFMHLYSLSIAYDKKLNTKRNSTEKRSNVNSLSKNDVSNSQHSLLLSYQFDKLEELLSQIWNLLQYEIVTSRIKISYGCNWIESIPSDFMEGTLGSMLGDLTTSTPVPLVSSICLSKPSLSADIKMTNIGTHSEVKNIKPVSVTSNANFIDFASYARTLIFRNSQACLREHIIEFNTVKQLCLGHVDLKFTLQEAQLKDQVIYVTLLRQQKMKLSKESNITKGHPNSETLINDLEAPFIDDDVPFVENITNSMQPSAETLRKLKGEIISGPYVLNKYFISPDSNQVHLTMTSGTLIKTRSRHYAIHISVKPVNSGIKRMDSPFTSREISESKFCDGFRFPIKSVSICLRKFVKQPVRNERAQRVSLFRNMKFIKTLLKFITERQSNVSYYVKVKYSLDIFNWIVVMLLNDLKPHSEKILNFLAIVNLFIEPMLLDLVLKGDRETSKITTKIFLSLINLERKYYSFENLSTITEKSFLLSKSLLKLLKIHFNSIVSVDNSIALQNYLLILNRLEGELMHKSHLDSKSFIDVSSVEVKLDLLKQIASRLTDLNENQFSICLRKILGYEHNPTSYDLFDVSTEISKQQNSNCLYSNLNDVTRKSNQLKTMHDKFKSLCHGSMSSQIQYHILKKFQQVLSSKKPENKDDLVEELDFSLEQIKHAFQRMIIVKLLDNMNIFEPAGFSRVRTKYNNDKEEQLNRVKSDGMKVAMHLEEIDAQSLNPWFSLKSNQNLPSTNLSDNFLNAIHTQNLSGINSPIISNFTIKKKLNSSNNDIIHHPIPMYNKPASKPDKRSLAPITSPRYGLLMTDSLLSQIVNVSGSEGTQLEVSRTGNKAYMHVTRLHANAKRYLILEFDQPVLITDIIIPQNENLQSLIIKVGACITSDIKGTESQHMTKIVTHNLIRTQPLYLFNIQPLLMCESVQIMIMARSGIAATRATIDIGCLYGRRPFIDSTYSQITDYMITLLPQYHTLLSQYSFACTSLRDKVNTLINTNIIPYFVNPSLWACFCHTFIDKSSYTNPKFLNSLFASIHRAYNNCCQIQHQVSLMNNKLIVLKKQVKDNNQSDIDKYDSLESSDFVSACNEDKLKVLLEVIFESLILETNFIGDYNIDTNFSNFCTLMTYILQHGNTYLQASLIFWLPKMLAKAKDTENGKVFFNRWFFEWFQNLLIQNISNQEALSSCVLKEELCTMFSIVFQQLSKLGLRETLILNMMELIKLSAHKTDSRKDIDSELLTILLMLLDNILPIKLRFAGNAEKEYDVWLYSFWKKYFQDNAAIENCQVKEENLKSRINFLKEKIVLLQKNKEIFKEYISKVKCKWLQQVITHQYVSTYEKLLSKINLSLNKLKKKEGGSKRKTVEDANLTEVINESFDFTGLNIPLMETIEILLLSLDKMDFRISQDTFIMSCMVVTKLIILAVDLKSDMGYIFDVNDDEDDDDDDDDDDNVASSVLFNLLNRSFCYCDDDARLFTLHALRQMFREVIKKEVFQLDITSVINEYPNNNNYHQHYHQQLFYEENNNREQDCLAETIENGSYSNGTMNDMGQINIGSIGPVEEEDIMEYDNIMDPDETGYIDSMTPTDDVDEDENDFGSNQHYLQTNVGGDTYTTNSNLQEHYAVFVTQLGDLNKSQDNTLVEDSTSDDYMDFLDELDLLGHVPSYSLSQNKQMHEFQSDQEMFNHDKKSTNLKSKSIYANTHPKLSETNSVGYNSFYDLRLENSIFLDQELDYNKRFMQWKTQVYSELSSSNATESVGNRKSLILNGYASKNYKLIFLRSVLNCLKKLIEKKTITCLDVSEISTFVIYIIELLQKSNPITEYKYLQTLLAIAQMVLEKMEKNEDNLLNYCKLSLFVILNSVPKTDKQSHLYSPSIVLSNVFLVAKNMKLISDPVLNNLKGICDYFKTSKDVAIVEFIYNIMEESSVKSTAYNQVSWIFIQSVSSVFSWLLTDNELRITFLKKFFMYIERILKELMMDNQNYCFKNLIPISFSSRLIEIETSILETNDFSDDKISIYMNVPSAIINLLGPIVFGMIRAEYMDLEMISVLIRSLKMCESKGYETAGWENIIDIVQCLEKISPLTNGSVGDWAYWLTVRVARELVSECQYSGLSNQLVLFVECLENVIFSSDVTTFPEPLFYLVIWLVEEESKIACDPPYAANRISECLTKILASQQRFRLAFSPACSVISRFAIIQLKNGCRTPNFSHIYQNQFNNLLSRFNVSPYCYIRCLSANITDGQALQRLLFPTINNNLFSSLTPTNLSAGVKSISENQAKALYSVHGGTSVTNKHKHHSNLKCLLESGWSYDFMPHETSVTLRIELPCKMYIQKVLVIPKFMKDIGRIELTLYTNHASLGYQQNYHYVHDYNNYVTDVLISLDTKQCCSLSDSLDIVFHRVSFSSSSKLNLKQIDVLVINQWWDHRFQQQHESTSLMSFRMLYLLQRSLTYSKMETPFEHLLPVLMDWSHMHKWTPETVVSKLLTNLSIKTVSQIIGTILDKCIVKSKRSCNILDFIVNYITDLNNISITSLQLHIIYKILIEFPYYIEVILKWTYEIFLNHSSQMDVIYKRIAPIIYILSTVIWQQRSSIEWSDLKDYVLYLTKTTAEMRSSTCCQALLRLLCSVCSVEESFCTFVFSLDYTKNMELIYWTCLSERGCKIFIESTSSMFNCIILDLNNSIIDDSFNNEQKISSLLNFFSDLCSSGCTSIKYKLGEKEYSKFWEYLIDHIVQPTSHLHLNSISDQIKNVENQYTLLNATVKFFSAVTFGYEENQALFIKLLIKTMEKYKLNVENLVMSFGLHELLVRVVISHPRYTVLRRSVNSNDSSHDQGLLWSSILSSTSYSHPWLTGEMIKCNKLGVYSLDMNYKLTESELRFLESRIIDYPNFSGDFVIMDYKKSNVENKCIKFPSPLLEKFCNKGGLCLLGQMLPLLYEEIRRISYIPVPISTKNDSQQTLIPPPHCLPIFAFLLQIPDFSRILLANHNAADTLLYLFLGRTGIETNSGVCTMKTDNGASSENIDNDTLESLPLRLFIQFLNDPQLCTNPKETLSKFISLGLLDFFLSLLTVFGHLDSNRNILKMNQTGPHGSILLQCLEDLMHHQSNANVGTTNGSARTVNSEFAKNQIFGFDDLTKNMHHGGSIGNSGDNKKQYWAKGTGFGTGAMYSTWDAETVLIRQKFEERHSAVIIECLAAAVSASIRVTGNELTDELVCVLARPLSKNDSEQQRGNMLLHRFLCAQLRNDSVLDISQRVTLYKAILRLVRTLLSSRCFYGLVLPELVMSPISDSLSIAQMSKMSNRDAPYIASITKLLSQLKTCVDTYINRLKKVPHTAISKPKENTRKLTRQMCIRRKCGMIMPPSTKYSDVLKACKMNSKEKKEDDNGVGTTENIAQLVPDINETVKIVEEIEVMLRNEQREREALARIKDDASNTDDSNTSDKNSDATIKNIKDKEAEYIMAMKNLQFGMYEIVQEKTLSTAKTNGSEGNNRGDHNQSSSVRFTVPYHFRKNVEHSISTQGATSVASANSLIRARRLAQETVTLSTSLPLSYSSSVFVQCDENHLDVMKVIIVGPPDTPYANGCFEFDVYFPGEYPKTPPLIHLETTGNGTVRFNPNLYNEGKVCLSILNTWHGRPEERWNSKTSSFLQVLVSIQSLILVPEPYFNEPGYERSRGTLSGNSASLAYSANIQVATARWAILEMLRNPPICFREAILTHFRLKKQEILSQLQGWIDFYSSLIGCPAPSKTASTVSKLNPFSATVDPSLLASTRPSVATSLQSLKKYLVLIKKEFEILDRNERVNENLFKPNI